MKNNYITKLAKKLANLQLAISLLFSIGIIISVGTIIEQDQALNFYKENYPITSPMFGFLTWELITFLNLDRIYTAWWFVVLLILFAASLLSCTLTTQLPSIKTFKIWKFYNKPNQLKTLSIASTLNLGLFNSFAYHCNDNNYHFFRQSKKGYAYSGLLGRVAPAVVHISIVLLLIGSTFGSFSGYTAQQFVPRGEITHIQNLTKFGNISSLPQDLSFRINDFWITYTKDLKTDQFYSDLSLLTNEGKELKRKTIFVNEPLVFNNIVLYQTDWDIVGLKIKLSNNEIFQVPVKKITKGNRKFWFCSLPTDSVTGKKLSVVINDLTGQFLIYDSKGVLLQEASVGSFANLGGGLKVQFLSLLTTTGLQIKSDPGIQTVYFSFLLLMLSIYVSFFTYSQIWLVETAQKISVGGNSNRAVLFFQQQFRKILKRVVKITG
mgnify:CR=1 FL=1|tara:strand:- start:35707 stop:37014 length:1308 start_codon:yes stop_codon:yes gene_type:complete